MSRPRWHIGGASCASGRSGFSKMIAFSLCAHLLLVLAIARGKSRSIVFQDRQVWLVSSADIASPVSRTTAAAHVPEAPHRARSKQKRAKAPPPISPRKVAPDNTLQTALPKNSPDGLQAWWRKKIKAISRNGKQTPPAVRESDPSPSRTEQTVPQTSTPPVSTAPIHPDGSVATGIVSADPTFFQFPYYATQVREIVDRHWAPPAAMLRETHAAVVVHFGILKSGEIIAVTVEKSSGDDLFDQAALRAVYAAKRFPPFPLGLEKEPLEVSFRFSTFEKES